MAVLDDLVVDQFVDRILVPERLEALLSELMARHHDKSRQLADEGKQLRKALRETDSKIDRLYEALTDGLVKDGDSFRRSLAKLEQQKEELLRRTSSFDRARNLPKGKFSAESLNTFSRVLKARIQDPDSGLRKRYIRLFIDRVEVADEEIRILGNKAALANGISEMTKPGHRNPVPSFGT